MSMSKPRFVDILEEENSQQSLEDRVESGQRMDEMMTDHEPTVAPAPTPTSRELGTLLDFLQIIWNDTKNLSIMGPLLVEARRTTVRKRQLDLAKKLYGMEAAIKEAMKKLKVNNLSTNCSFGRFKKLCHDEEFYMMFTRGMLVAEEMDCLIDAWELVTQEPCSSSAAMKTTTTSSTIAASTPARAGAHGSKRLKTADTSDSEDDLFAQTNIPSGIGGISQSISRRADGKWISFTSPGEHGYNIVKVDVIPFSEAQTMDKSNWWKIATTRCLFITSSIADPLDQMTEKLLKKVQKNLKQTTELKMAVKGTDLRNSFKNIQHHH